MISVIIPTLNEEHFLRHTIRHAMSMASGNVKIEYIVVDAGSQDQTLETINDLPVRTYKRPDLILKKYASLNFGIAESSGNIVMLLDADTKLPTRFDELIINALQDEKVVGGAFAFSFQNPDWKLRLLTVINRIRYQFGRIYYGDQAVFVRKEVLDQIAGVPEEPLMEVAYLCKRLKRLGKLALVRPGVITSPRRFIEHGFFRTFWFDAIMFIRFKLGLPVAHFGERYWQKNLLAK